MLERTENEPVILNVESKAVQLHLEFLQDIISRLSSKSSTCKNWCITLTSAFILLSLRLENGSQYILLSYIPILIFFILNTYYVYLERSFRRAYEAFIEKLHQEKLQINDIYKISPQSEENSYQCQNFRSAMGSTSILIFYLPLLMIVIVITLMIKCS